MTRGAQIPVLCLSQISQQPAIFASGITDSQNCATYPRNRKFQNILSTMCDSERNAYDSVKKKRGASEHFHFTPEIYKLQKLCSCFILEINIKKRSLWRNTN